VEAHAYSRRDNPARLHLDRLDAMLDELEDLNLRGRPQVPAPLGNVLQSLGVNQPSSRSVSELIEVVFDLQEPVLHMLRHGRQRRPKLARLESYPG
jgi:hypothetical protein